MRFCVFSSLFSTLNASECRDHSSTRTRKVVLRETKRASLSFTRSQSGEFLAQLGLFFGAHLVDGVPQLVGVGAQIVVLFEAHLIGEQTVDGVLLVIQAAHARIGIVAGVLTGAVDVGRA